MLGMPEILVNHTPRHRPLGAGLLKSALCAVVLGSLVACGQRGPLTLPKDPAAADRATLPQTLLPDAWRTAPKKVPDTPPPNPGSSPPALPAHPPPPLNPSEDNE